MSSPSSIATLVALVGPASIWVVFLGGLEWIQTHLKSDTALMLIAILGASYIIVTLIARNRYLKIIELEKTFKNLQKVEDFENMKNELEHCKERKEYYKKMWTQKRGDK